MIKINVYFSSKITTYLNDFWIIQRAGVALKLELGCLKVHPRKLTICTPLSYILKWNQSNLTIIKGGGVD